MMNYSYIERQLGLVTALLGPPLDVDLPRVTDEQFQWLYTKGKCNTSYLCCSFVIYTAHVKRTKAFCHQCCACMQVEET